jgi:hypothetical protein
MQVRHAAPGVARVADVTDDLPDRDRRTVDDPSAMPDRWARYQNVPLGSTTRTVRPPRALLAMRAVPWAGDATGVP